MIRHRANGAVGALHMADLRRVGVAEAFHRLVAYKGGAVSEPWLVALWVAYVAGTLAIAMTASRRGSLRGCATGRP
jgi:hypothetical protein